jgi:hypothetical protein
MWPRTGRESTKLGWRKDAQEPRPRELAIGDVPLTRLAFALSAAFEAAAPSAAVGWEGWKMQRHNGENNDDKDMNPLLGIHTTTLKNKKDTQILG